MRPGPSRSLTYPDESFLLGAAGIAYSRWVSVTDPTIVAVRERTQRVASHRGRHRRRRKLYGHRGTGLQPGAVAGLPRTRRRTRQTGRGDRGPRGDPQPSAPARPCTTPPTSPGRRPPSPNSPQARMSIIQVRARIRAQQDPGSAAEDLAAAEAAITLLRENRDRHGYSAEDADDRPALCARSWTRRRSGTRSPRPTTGGPTSAPGRRICARTGSARTRVSTTPSSWTPVSPAPPSPCNAAAPPTARVSTSS